MAENIAGSGANIVYCVCIYSWMLTAHVLRTSADLTINMKSLLSPSV